MAKPPDRQGSVSRLVLVAIVIAVGVIAVIVAAVWQPLATSLHLTPAPTPTRGAHPVQYHAHYVAGNRTRAP